jgi:hypothetical protein
MCVLTELIRGFISFLKYKDIKYAIVLNFLDLLDMFGEAKMEE